MYGRTTAIAWTLLSSLLLLASSAWAKKIPDVEIVESAKGHWLVCPAGDGPSLQESGVAVTLRLSAMGAPLANFPWQDLWLSADVADSRGPCGWAAVMPDAASDADGLMTISGAGVAGGHSVEGLVIYAEGMDTTEYDPPVPILRVRMNSPDIDGDGVVNLADVALFAQDMLQYDVRSDLDPSGSVDLADLAVLTEHLGHHCQ
jgi:hypothetical protein